MTLSNVFTFGLFEHVIYRSYNDFLYIFVPFPHAITFGEEETLQKFTIENIIRAKIESYRQVLTTYIVLSHIYSG